MRKLLYTVLTLGLLLTCIPDLASNEMVGSRWMTVLSCLGWLVNCPGHFVVASLVGLPNAMSIWGRLIGWLLNLAFCELLIRWTVKPLTESPEDPKALMKVTRRSFLIAGGGAAGATLLTGYSCGYEIRHLQLEQFRLALPQLPSELSGLRIVLMADWHCGPINRPDYLQRAMQMANDCKPDLIFLPGDFVSKSGEFFHEAAELAASLRTNIPGGVIVSWGNHDYWHKPNLGFDLMPQAGCQVLTNQKLLLNAKKEFSEEGRGLWVCGLDDLWAGKPSLTETLKGIPADQPRLVLCHNPDVAEEQQGPRVDLMLSGHTHGGQVRIPAIGAPIVPSSYGQKYASGLVQAPDYKVYISRGLGSSGIPVRFGVPPEITLFELCQGSQVGLQPARIV